MSTEALAVSIGDTRIGTLERHDDFDGVFSFDRDYLADPDAPVLGQIFEDRRPRDLRAGGLLLWFEHLLPQGALRRAIAREARIDEADGWALLTHLGADLPGAVVVAPTEPRLSTRRGPAPAPVSEEHALRFALSGQQLKMSLREGERGLTAAVDGEGTRWIAKFPSPSFPDLPRVEQATMEWARRAGLAIPRVRQARIDDVEGVPSGFPTADGRIYLIERFDRLPHGAREHIEDFAQVLDRPDPYRGHYEEIAAVLAELQPYDVERFIHQLVFCVLAGNTDAHLKNFSLRYPGNQRYASLAPPYDMVASVLYTPHIPDELALCLAGSARFEEVTVESFRHLWGPVEWTEDLRAHVRELAEAVREAWRAGQSELELTVDERARIERHMARVRL